MACNLNPFLAAWGEGFSGRIPVLRICEFNTNPVKNLAS